MDNTDRYEEALRAARERYKMFGDELAEPTCKGEHLRTRLSQQALLLRIFGKEVARPEIKTWEDFRVDWG